MSVRASVSVCEFLRVCVCVCGRGARGVEGLLPHKIPKVIILIQHEPQVCCIYFQAKRNLKNYGNFTHSRTQTHTHTHVKTRTHTRTQLARPFSGSVQSKST